MKPTLFVGSITVEDMKRTAEEMRKRGATAEEIEARVSEMENRSNIFLASVFGMTEGVDLKGALQ